jgi:hypothetical protein
MKFGEAKALLEEYGILIGAIVADADVTDTLNSYIFWQNPERFDDEKRLQHIRSGQTMDVKLQISKPVRDSLDKNGEPVKPGKNNDEL